MKIRAKVVALLASVFVALTFVEWGVGQALLLPRFDQLRASHPGLAGMQRIAALLHLAAGDDVARGLAAAWATDQPEDPEARLCRMRTSLRAGDLPAALDDAMSAVQLAVDRGAMLAAVGSLCDAAAGEAPTSVHADIRAMAASFRALPQ